MILDFLKLKNFGLYRGDHVLDLRPDRRNGRARPIVLIGGMNGGGKTTLFDAVQLALYGARGKYSKRTNVPYDEFLRESIHRGVTAAEGASVSLTFRISSAAQEHVYEVRRVWTQRGQALRERLFVFKDGEADQSLAEHWTDLVEEVIPLGVSQLFFFDAEKVRFLADDLRGNDALGAAIKSLLGLDLAERLIADSAVLETRLSQSIQKSEQNAEIDNFVTLLTEKQEQIRLKREERASLENFRLRAQNQVQELNDEFERSGGRHWKNRASRERKLQQMSVREEELTSQLLRFASGPLPLAMLPALLASASRHDQQENDLHAAQLIFETLAKRDAQMIREFRKEGLRVKDLDTIREVLKRDRDKRKPTAKADLLLELPETARYLLAPLAGDILPRLQGELRELLSSFNDVIRERDSLQRMLKQTPGNADIADVVDRLNEGGKELAVLEDRAARFDEEIRVLSLQHDEIDRQLRKRRRETIEHELHAEEAARMAQMAIRTQAAMKEYLRLATTNKIDRLSGLVTDSFRYLLRKKTLVESVQIDPTSFDISLFDKEGQAIPKQRLSEGEKQIFAISVLWGLAQASPRPLPAIIDTPMARLDSEHRNHLIERYFPQASHQVIILSTDTEVNEGFYSALEPHLARAYHLNYDEKTKVTTPTEGYFWRLDAVASEKVLA